jgi:hypothetical protein
LYLFCKTRFYCDIPDEYVFSNQATLKELAKAVKIGRLTDEQKHHFEGHPTHNTNDPKAAGGGSGNGHQHPPDYSNVVVTPHRQPLCPWFTCCY